MHFSSLFVAIVAALYLPCFQLSKIERVAFSLSLSLWLRCIGTAQCRLLLGSLCYIRPVFHLNCLTAHLSLKGELRLRGPNSISKFDHHTISGGAVDDT
jgi:hypothetical protein